MPGFASLPAADQDVLTQLISRPGRNLFFISRLIVNIPKGEANDIAVMAICDQIPISVLIDQNWRDYGLT